METDRCLIVNADDFGLSSGVNRGIIEAHEHGIVTSASLMVRWPAAAEAASYGHEHAALSLGLHVDLGEWTYRDGDWAPLYEVVPLKDSAAVATELSRQLDTFRRLVGADPTHIDSHQHIHLQGPVRPVMVEIAQNLGVPLRHCTRTIRYCGGFYGQTAEGLPVPECISVEGLINILARLTPGITELACHPGRIDRPEPLNTMYRQERAQEVDVLCHPRVQFAIRTMGIEMRSFRSTTIR